MHGQQNIKLYERQYIYTRTFQAKYLINTTKIYCWRSEYFYPIKRLQY